jgi:hypothetical protein
MSLGHGIHCRICSFLAAFFSALSVRYGHLESGSIHYWQRVRSIEYLVSILHNWQRGRSAVRDSIGNCQMREVKVTFVESPSLVSAQSGLTYCDYYIR